MVRFCSAINSINVLLCITLNFIALKFTMRLYIDYSGLLLNFSQTPSDNVLTNINHKDADQSVKDVSAYPFQT